MVNTQYNYMLGNFLNRSDCKLSNGTKKKLRALYQNNMTFQFWFNHLLDLAIYAIHIRVKKNDSPDDVEDSQERDETEDELPGGIDERIMMLSFIFNDCVVLTDGVKWNGAYYPGKYSFMGYPSGKGWNLKGNPLSAFIYSMYNGFASQEIPLNIPEAQEAPATKIGFSGQKQTEDPLGYMIWAHPSRSPLIYPIIYFASAITDSYRTLDVTRFWLKRPVIFTADKELVNSINNVIAKMELNEEWTIESNALGDVKQNTQLFNTNANGQSLKDVTGLIGWLMSQYKALIGMNANSQMDKKGENVTYAEISVDDEYQSANIEIMTTTMNKYFHENAPFYGIELEAVARYGQKQAELPTIDQEQEGDNDNGNGLQNIPGMG